MLALKIISPTAKQRFPSIEWNYEELKSGVAEYVKDYSNLVVTPDSEKDCKEVRANLNRLRTEIENARKEMKKKVNEPFALFEEQIKSVEVPLDEAIANLDGQLNELTEYRKEQKKEDIKTLWDSMSGVPEYLTLEKVWNKKWLNATYSMKQITSDLTGILTKNRNDVETIQKLPYAYEAMEYYKDTLDVTAAIQKASEVAEIAKRKEMAQQSEAKSFIMPGVPQNGVDNKTNTADTEVKKYTYRFEISVTKEQAEALGMFCRNQGITLKRLQ